MVTKKQQSNPFSTGGGGINFETRVQAAFTTFMLTGGVVPCLPPWPIQRIKLQGKHAGFDTDDCVVFLQSPTGDQNCKLLAQIKHSVDITESSVVFAEVIKTAWDDFNNSEVFAECSDSIALITGPLPAVTINHVRPLLEWARHCENEKEYFDKVKTPKFSSKNKEEKLKVFRHHLRKANSDVDVDDNMVWRFLKSFHLIGYDLDTESGGTLPLIQGLISQRVQDENPASVWTDIVDLVQTVNQNAGTITYDNIPAGVRSKFTKSRSAALEQDINKLREHGEYILEEIRTDIAGCHISRLEIFQQLLDVSEEADFIYLAGPRGCGKSGVAKEFAQQVEKHFPVFCLRAEDMNEPHLDRVFSAIGLRTTVGDLSAHFALIPQKFIFIESLEKILELQNTKAFSDLLNFLKKSTGWTVIATGRDYAYQQITRHFLQQNNTNWTSLNVSEFDDAELNTLLDKVMALRPLGENEQIRGLLRTPFLGELAVRVVDAGTRFEAEDGEAAFRTAVWRDVIAKEQERTGGLPVKRKRAFIDIAVKRAKAMAYGVPERDFNSDALLKLEEDNLINRNTTTSLVSPAHDVLEDWALDEYVEDTYQKDSGAQIFLNEVGFEPAMNRAFRLWLHRKLRNATDISNIAKLVVDVIALPEEYSVWKDEVVSAILMGENSLEFLDMLTPRLFENDATLLKRVCFVLRIACKAPEGDGDLQLLPLGNGWEAIIQFLFRNKDDLGKNLFSHITSVLYEWSMSLNVNDNLPDSAREAGLLALYLLDFVKDNYDRENGRKKLLESIIRLVPAIKEEFTDLIQQDILGKTDSRDNRYPGYVRQFLPMVLVGIETYALSKIEPDIVIHLARKEWFLPEVEKGIGWHDELDKVETSFGLHEHSEAANFFPASGAKGPFKALLIHHPRKGLDFIIELCNKTAEKYAKSSLDNKEKDFFQTPGYSEGVSTITISLDDETTVSHYCSHRLWCAYRGTVVVPYLLQSALMALENWLVEIIELGYKQETLEWIVDHILRNSNSVMPTAVIAAVAMGFTEQLGRFVLPLLRVPELYQWDFLRSFQESQALGAGWSHDPYWKLYAQERDAANKRPWRKENFESLVGRLQFSDLKKEVSEILDELNTYVAEELSSNPPEQEKWRFRLHRMDIRDCEPQLDEENNRILLIPKEIEPDLKEIQDESQEESTRNNRYIAMTLWSEKVFKNEEPDREYYVDREAALEEAKNLLEMLKEGEVNEMMRMNYGGIVRAAAIFTRDHLKELSKKDAEWCTEVVVEAATANAETDDHTRIVDATGHDGSAAAGKVLPCLFDTNLNDEEQEGLKLMISVVMMHVNNNMRKEVAKGIGEHLWSRNPDFAQTCINGAIEFARLREEEIKSRRHAHLEAENNSVNDSEKPQERWIDKLRQAMVSGEVPNTLDDITFDTHSAWCLIEPLLMVPDGSTNPEHVSLIERILTILRDAIIVNEECRHSSGDKINLPNEFETDFAKKLASYFMAAPGNIKQRLTDNLAEICDTAPGLVKSTLTYLLCIAETEEKFEDYWDIWRKLSGTVEDIAIKHSSVDTRYVRYGDRTSLISSMLLSDTPWNQMPIPEKIISPGVESICAFVENAGCNPIVFGAMAQYLYGLPHLFMPKGMELLAKHQGGVGGISLLSGTNTVFYLEGVFQKLILQDDQLLRQSSEIRDCAYVILNAMVETGSSTAYFLRERLMQLKMIH